jgi:hypothetical protein
VASGLWFPRSRRRGAVYGWETGTRVPSAAHLLCLIAAAPEFRLLAHAAASTP